MPDLLGPVQDGGDEGITMMKRIAIAWCIAMAAGAATAVENEQEVCAGLAGPAREFATRAEIELGYLRGLRANSDLSAYLDGAELSAARALGEVYGPLLPQYELYAERVATFAAVMEACAAQR